MKKSKLSQLLVFMMFLTFVNVNAQKPESAGKKNVHAKEQIKQGANHNNGNNQKNKNFQNQLKDSLDKTSSKLKGNPNKPKCDTVKCPKYSDSCKAKKVNCPDTCKYKNQNNGNAYGKDKGNLTGKEFGQLRASEAKAKLDSVSSKLDETIDSTKLKIADAKEKIKVAKEKLEKDKSAKKITEQQYTDKKKKIEDAEKKLFELEEKVKKGQSLQN